MRSGGLARYTIYLVGLSLAVFALYILTRSHDHSWDAIAYTARIHDNPLVSERYLSTRYFHPHHLLYVPIGKAAVAVAGTVGGARDPFLVVQLLSAFCGAGSVLLCGLLLRRVPCAPPYRYAAPAVLGLSNGIWLYSTEVEVMLPALLLLLLALLLAGGADRPRDWIAAGGVLSLAVGVHQIAVLPALAMSLAVLFPPARGERWSRGPLLLIGTWVLAVATLYAAAGVQSADVRGLRDLLAWVFAAASRSTFSALSFGGSLYRALREVVESFVSLALVRDVRLHGLDSVGTSFRALGLCAALGGTVAILARVCFRAARRGPDEEVAVRASRLSAVALFGFITWFEPRNLEYWVYIVPFLVILAASGAGSAGGPGKAGPNRMAHRLSHGIAAGVYLVSLSLTNFVSTVHPRTDPRNAAYAGIVRFAGEHFTAGDLVVTGGAASPIGVGLVALPVFASVEVLSVEAAESGGEIDRSFPSVLARMESVKGRGREVFEYGAGESVLWRLRAAGWDCREVGVVNEVPVHELVPRFDP